MLTIHLLYYRIIEQATTFRANTHTHTTWLALNCHNICSTGSNNRNKSKNKHKHNNEDVKLCLWWRSSINLVKEKKQRQRREERASITRATSNNNKEGKRRTKKRRRRRKRRKKESFLSISSPLLFSPPYDVCICKLLLLSSSSHCHRAFRLFLFQCYRRICIGFACSGSSSSSSSSKVATTSYLRLCTHTHTHKAKYTNEKCQIAAARRLLPSR